VLTGDTLFIGDVGRPDLAGGRGYSAEEMAGLLYDSLHSKLLTLPDDVEVYPAHGAGSACGRNISKETSSTIGQQRRMNYALQPMPREEFIRMMTTDLSEPPSYFPMDVEINRRGAAPLDSVPVIPLPLSAVQEHVAAGATLLDVRDCEAFGDGHIPGSINIGLGGQYASWAGSLLSPRDPIIVVASDEVRATEAVRRLARVGMENVAGFLEGGFEAWVAAGLPVARLTQLEVGALRSRLDSESSLQVLDVRARGEYASGHLPRAVNIPLPELERNAHLLDPARPLAVVCAGGYRSSVAASLLEKRGFRELGNVTGGTAAWIRAGFPTSQS
jgi:rhodanese-related sulfurtransferase